MDFSTFHLALDKLQASQDAMNERMEERVKILEQALDIEKNKRRDECRSLHAAIRELTEKLERLRKTVLHREAGCAKVRHTLAKGQEEREAEEERKRSNEQKVKELLTIFAEQRTERARQRNNAQSSSSSNINSAVPASAVPAER